MQWFDDLVLINFIKSKPVLEQFIKFGLVGLFNTVVDFTTYLFFTRVVLWSYLIAATIAFVVAASSSFLLNRYWTFRVKNSDFAKEYLKFFIVAFGGLLLTLLILYILVDIFYWYDLFAKFLTIIVVVNWNFFLQKYWTFKK